MSPAVVSLVINGRTNGKIRISEETQTRVRQAVRDLGYVPNLAARQLAGGRNHLIGVFTYEPVFPLGEGNFYYPFLVGIEEQAEALGYDLLLFTRNDRETGRRMVYREGINALQTADGAVLLGTNEDRAELSRLVAEGFPFVFAGRREVDGEPLVYVGADYASAAVEVIDHLAGFGHTNMLYLTDQGGLSESSLDRRDGVLRGMRQAAIPDPEDRVIAITPSLLDGEQLLSWLSAGVTALVVQSLVLAQAVLRVASSRGLQVPAAFSLAALGNSHERVDDDGTITSIDIPQREMGAGSVQLLVDLLDHPETMTTKQVLLPCRLRRGRTVGPVPQSAIAGTFQP